MRQFAVIGLGQFGMSVAKTLSARKCQVLAIDINEDRIEEISDIVTHAVLADGTDEKALRSLEIGDIDVAIVGLGESMEASILVTLLLKELGVKKVVAKAISGLHAKILKKLGVDRIVFPERDTGTKVAEGLVTPNILEHIELSPEYSVIEIVASGELIGKNLRKLNLRAKYGVDVIAIKRKIPVINDAGESDIKEEIEVIPRAEAEIKDGDILIVVGNILNIKELEKNERKA